MDAQANLSLGLANLSEGTFSHLVAHIIFYTCWWSYYVMNNVRTEGLSKASCTAEPHYKMVLHIRWFKGESQVLKPNKKMYRLYRKNGHFSI